MKRKVLAMILALSLLFQQLGFAQVAMELNLAGYFNQMGKGFIQDKFRPEHLRYFSYDNLNNEFKVLLDKGDLKNLDGSQLQDSTRILLNYFLIGVTLPDKSFWVNLRPDSEDQIIDAELARTDLGKVMLETDLQLKKDTAIFTSPETTEGREYWNRLYKKSEEIFGDENVTIPTLTRPWIVPNEVIVRESKESAYIYKATLKVMLEQDYLKDSSMYNFKDERMKELNEYSSQLIRELIIPKLNKEVNTSKKYAGLRQVYYSLILARWFKARFQGKGGTYASLIDKKDLAGLTSTQSWSKTTYFKEYQKSFQQGEYNIKEPVRTPSGQVIRSYFSGGEALQVVKTDQYLMPNAALPQVANSTILLGKEDLPGIVSAELIEVTEEKRVPVIAQEILAGISDGPDIKAAVLTPEELASLDEESVAPPARAIETKKTKVSSALAVNNLANALIDAGLQYDPEGFGYIVFPEDNNYKGAPRFGKPMDDAIDSIERFEKRHYGDNPDKFTDDVIINVIGIGGQTTSVLPAVGLIVKHNNRKIIVHDSLGKNMKALEEEWVESLRASRKAGNNTKLLWVVGSKSGTTDETMLNFQMVLLTMIKVWSRVGYGDEKGREIAQKLIAKLFDGKPLAEKNPAMLNLTGSEEAVLKEIFSNLAIVTGKYDDSTGKGSRLDQFRKGFLTQLFAGNADEVISILMLDNLGGRFQGIGPNAFVYNALLGMDIRSMLQGAKDEALRQRSDSEASSKKAARQLYDKNIHQLLIAVPDEERFGRFAELVGQNIPESTGKARTLGKPLGIQTYLFDRKNIKNAFKNIALPGPKAYLVIDVKGEPQIELGDSYREGDLVIRHTMESISEYEVGKMIQFVEDVTVKYGMLNTAKMLLETKESSSLLQNVNLNDAQVLKEVMQGVDKSDLLYPLHDVFNAVTPFRQPDVEGAKQLVREGRGVALYNPSGETDKDKLPVRSEKERVNAYTLADTYVNDGLSINLAQIGLLDKGEYKIGSDAAAVLSGLTNELKGTIAGIDLVDLNAKEEETARQLAVLLLKAHKSGKTLNFVLYEDDNPLTESIRRFARDLGIDRFDFGPAEQHKSFQLRSGGVDVSIEVMVQSVKGLESKVKQTEYTITADGNVPNYLHGLFPSEVGIVYLNACTDNFKTRKTEVAVLMSQDLTEAQNAERFKAVLKRMMEIYKNNITEPVAAMEKGGVASSTLITLDPSKADLAKISFPTAGWRSKFPEHGGMFSKANVYSVNEACAQYVLDEKEFKRGDMTLDRSVTIVYDMRKHMPEFAREIATIYAQKGIKVYLINQPPSTPLGLFTARQLKSAMMVNLTASHNPPEDGGIEFFDMRTVGLAHNTVNEAVMENLKKVEKVSYYENINNPALKGLIEKINPLFDEYITYLKEEVGIDFEVIKRVKPRIVFDALHGTGGIMQELAKRVGIEDSFVFERVDMREDAGGLKTWDAADKDNLAELSGKVLTHSADGLLSGDGDFDRMQLVLENGTGLVPNHFFTMLAYYQLDRLKKEAGKNFNPAKYVVIRTIPSTSWVDKVALHFGIPEENIKVVPVGFRWVNEAMNEAKQNGFIPVLAFEESGGGSPENAMPYKDGLACNLKYAEIISRLKEQGRTLSDLYKELIDKVAENFDAREDRKLVVEDKTIAEQYGGKNGKVLQYFKGLLLQEWAIGSSFELEGQRFIVKSIDLRDGVQWVFTDGSRVCIRPSGTEPLFRVYPDSTNQQKYNALKNHFLNILAELENQANGVTVAKTKEGVAKKPAEKLTTMPSENLYKQRVLDALSKIRKIAAKWVDEINKSRDPLAETFMGRKESVFLRFDRFTTGVIKEDVEKYQAGVLNLRQSGVPGEDYAKRKGDFGPQDMQEIKEFLRVEIVRINGILAEKTELRQLSRDAFDNVVTGYSIIRLDTLEEKGETRSSSSIGDVDSNQPVNPNVVGGIDFRSLPMKIQPMGSFSGLNFNLPLLSSSALENINPDLEIQEMKNMIESGTVPSGRRFMELLAVCIKKNELNGRVNDLMACLMDIFRLEEENVSESSPELREALVILDAKMAG